MSSDNRPAGDGLSDEDFADRVAGQTSSDLEAEPVFEREKSGATTDAEVSDIDADSLSDD
jgi:hypothetical protein